MRATLTRSVKNNSPIARFSYLLAGTCLAAACTLTSPQEATAQSTWTSVNHSEYRIATRTQNRYRKQYRRRKALRKRKKAKQQILPVWHRQSTHSKDPVQIIISLPEQSITVYRGSQVVVKSRVSSGKPGYSSPSGVFSILQKNRKHRSNIYSDAPMPFMQRLTWSGIALHASNSVPDYPASHGCIRLPYNFASQLFKYTSMGAHVIVANEKVAPAEIDHDKLFQPIPRAPGVLASVQTNSNAPDTAPLVKMEKRSTAPLRILITRRNGNAQMREVQQLLNQISFGAGEVDGLFGSVTASAIRRFQATYGLRPNGMMSDDFVARLYEITGKGIPQNGHIYVRQNFKPIFDAPVTIHGGEYSLGSHLFTVQHYEPHVSVARWLAVTLTKGSPKNAYLKKKKARQQQLSDTEKMANAPLSSTASDALNRIEMSPEIRRHISELLTPGSSLAITNDGISIETMPKGSDFVLLMQ